MSLAGRLEDLALSDIFQILSIGKKTGTFIVNGTKGTAMIVFKGGMVVRAETSDLEGTLGEDLVKSGSVGHARETGHYRIEGRDYVVKDGDVMLFKINV